MFNVDCVVGVSPVLLYTVWLYIKIPAAQRHTLLLHQLQVLEDLLKLLLQKFIT